jgi:predicted nucleic acid-binding protein
MNYFFDSSALTKLFSTETGSDKVISIVEDANADIWISDLVRVEILSAVLRKFRNDEFSESELELILKAIREQLDLFNQITMSGNIVNEAEQLITAYGKTYGLRSLDALHIACWVQRSKRDLIFVTSDAVQNKVIQQLNGESLFVE